MRVGSSLLLSLTLFLYYSTSFFLMAGFMIIWMSYNLIHQFPIHGHLGGVQFSILMNIDRNRGTSIYIYFASFPIVY